MLTRGFIEAPFSHVQNVSPPSLPDNAIIAVSIKTAS